MELEQLVSFVRYQRGQKQGWDALDEVLTIVQESKERVAAGELAIAKAQQDLDAMQASLAQFNVLAQAKEDALIAKLAGMEADAKHASTVNAAALSEVLQAKTYQSSELDITLLAQTALSEQLAVEINQLQADKALSTGELARIKAQLADIKAKL